MPRTTQMSSKDLQAQLNSTWTTQNICTRYGVTAVTVGAWRALGLPAVVIRGTGATRSSIRFIPKEADQWIKHRRAKQRK